VEILDAEFSDDIDAELADADADADAEAVHA
jgi:hypothetical protein